VTDLGPILDESADHVELLESRYPQGFPADRNGVRLGIPSLEDELREVWYEWNLNKRRLPSAEGTLALEGELFDMLAVAVMIVKGIRGAHPRG